MRFHTRTRLLLHLKYPHAYRLSHTQDDVTADASFVKLKPEAVCNEDFASNVFVSSLNGSPVQSMYADLTPNPNPRPSR